MLIIAQETRVSSITESTVTRIETTTKQPRPTFNRNDFPSPISSAVQNSVSLLTFFFIFQ
jgi:hypothetical protein